MFGKALKGTLGVGVGCVVLILGLVIVAGALGGAARPSSNATTPPLNAAASTLPTSTPPVATAGKTWVVVKSWTGNGIRTPRTSPWGDPWRVDWDFTPAQFGGITQIYLYRSDNKQLVNLAANTQKGGADTSFQRGAGTYYMKVNSANGDWKVAVQDFR
jgi:hypothetical protein